jgi:hypothetical protein
MASCVSWTCLAEIGWACYMSVRHPEPECSKFCSSSSKQVTICQACQAYQLMHNTQGAARPRRTPTSRRSAGSICTSQLACGVSAPDSSKATSLLPYTDKQLVARKPRESDSASRFVRLVERAAVSPGRSCGPVYPRSWPDVWVMPMLCHTSCDLRTTHTHQDPMSR